MRRIPPGRAPALVAPQDGLRTLSAFSGELALLIERAQGSERAVAIDALGRRYRDCFTLTRAQIDSAIADAAKGLAELAGLFSVNLAKTPLYRQFQQAGAGAVSDTPEATMAVPDEALSEARDEFPENDAEAILTVGIQDISSALIEDCSPNELLQIVTETVFRAFGVRRAVFCVRDARTHQMQARIVLGADREKTRSHFHFPMTGQGDLFNAILSREIDVLISDAHEPKLRSRLPGWYTEHFNAPTFLVLPLRVRHTPVAMIYADMDTAGSLVVPAKALSLLRTLRNQAVLALKQAGG